jgi:hypothetical protein
VSFTGREDDKELTLSRSTEGDLQVFWLLRPRGDDRRPQGRLFLRGATQRARNRDLTLALDDRRTGWQLGAGVSLNAF